MFYLQLLVFAELSPPPNTHIYVYIRIKKKIGKKRINQLNLRSWQQILWSTEPCKHKTSVNPDSNAAYSFNLFFRQSGFRADNLNFLFSNHSNAKHLARKFQLTWLQWARMEFRKANIIRNCTQTHNTHKQTKLPVITIFADFRQLK